jgi:hypothetical protein
MKLVTAFLEDDGWMAKPREPMHVGEEGSIASYSFLRPSIGS